MRFRPLAAALAGLALLAATALPAHAIRRGDPDMDHPYVGLMLAYLWVDLNGDGEKADDELIAAWNCSGTLMDQDTFLTAGHCTDGAEAVAIWFGADLTNVQDAEHFVFFPDAIDQSDPSLAADAWSRTILRHPDYTRADYYLNDVSVAEDVTLAPGTAFNSYGELPELKYWDGQLATRKKDRDSYESVGYGLQWSMPPRGASANSNGRQSQDDWLRLKANGELIGNRNFGAGKDNDAYVVISGNAKTGGVCFGDSGGPTFIAKSNTVVAVTSFVKNQTCAGPGGVYRIDTADDLEWLAQFIDGQ